MLAHETLVNMVPNKPCFPGLSECFNFEVLNAKSTRIYLPQEQIKKSEKNENVTLASMATRK